MASLPMTCEPSQEHAIKKPDDIINEVAAAVDRFDEFAVKHGVTYRTRQTVGTQMRERLRELVIGSQRA